MAENRPKHQGQLPLDQSYPAVAQWIRGGWIEIGELEGYGFMARALDHGGVVAEVRRFTTLAGAMEQLEKWLAHRMEEQGMWPA